MEHSLGFGARKCQRINEVRSEVQPVIFTLASPGRKGVSDHLFLWLTHQSGSNEEAAKEDTEVKKKKKEVKKD